MMTTLARVGATLPEAEWATWEALLLLAEDDVVAEALVEEPVALAEALEDTDVELDE